MYLYRHLLRGLAGAIGLLAVAFAGPAVADSDAPFNAMAAEIVAGIRASDVNSVPAASGYGRPTIAVQRFAGNGLPVPAEVANSWNKRLLAALQRRARNQFSFVDRSALPALIREIERGSATPQEKADRLAALNANARADILVAGTVTLPGDVPVLAYQAIGTENGRLLASTAPRRIRFPEPPATIRTAGDRAPAPVLPVATGRRVRPVVLEAERLLRALGYDPGPVDGVLTGETRRALRAYQADSALPVNGRMTRETVQNMRHDTR